MASDLAKLGKVAGIGGIAVGAVVLILRPLIEGAVPGLAPEARAQAVLVIAVGAFALGAFGIVAWGVGSLVGRGGQVARGGRDVAAGGRDAVVSSRVVRSDAGGGGSGADGWAGRGGQSARGGRDAAAAGRDTVINSDISPQTEESRRGPRKGRR